MNPSPEGEYPELEQVVAQSFNEIGFKFPEGEWDMERCAKEMAQALVPRIRALIPELPEVPVIPKLAPPIPQSEVRSTEHKATDIIEKSTKLSGDWLTKGITPQPSNLIVEPCRHKLSECTCAKEYLGKLHGIPIISDPKAEGTTIRQPLKSDPTPPNPDIEDLKDALKKDWNALLVREFTTDWKNQRLVTHSEIEVMSFPNLIAYVEAEKRKELREVEAEIGRAGVTGRVKWYVQDRIKAFEGNTEEEV